ncbi:hypothetical protein SD70_02470 [Gordoniibacillus kamchatkensis]|uniref:Uncharacterized protein n=1 Tax=Gordoniibacillus kamchatkensis TaxID=1590651 RepID=A0ABR5AM89_9BACL|nr:hypothetical protein [Paenibacillus sp. VKM B-2647]KIL42067.1 hypothetical protein SD70_02470 [Paenibacillus sp. VKM B-2647]
MPFDNTSGLNISAQREFIMKHGEKVHYYTGMKCTCASSVQPTGSNLYDPNRANVSCAACKGIGWVWLDGGKIIGVVENINQHKDLLNSGIAAPGDLVFSPDLRVTLSDYDKIQLTWPQGIPFECELISRGSGASDSTLYGVMNVMQCIAVDPASGTVTAYNSGVDFVYDKNTPANQITWQGAHVPAAGVVYSLKYQALVDWIVFTPPQPRRERGTNLGQRVILRKRHIVFPGV